jgi:hypothetical protein
LSTYVATGLSKRTSVAPAAVAWSTLNSTAYVYALVEGSSPGIAAGPLAPTVYSVARTCRSPSGRVEPSGSFITAVVPRSNMSVAARVPSASLTGPPSATWIGAVECASIVVTFVSYGVMTTSSTVTYSCHGTSSVRCTVVDPSRLNSSVR